MTAPVTDAEVVVSKYLASLTFLVFMILPTLVYYGLVRLGGKPDVGPIVTQYLGILLVGSLYLAVGFFFSTLTRNQVLAAIMAIVVLMLLYFFEGLAYVITEGDQTSWVYQAARYVSPSHHVEAFAKGILDVSDVVYFLAFIVYFLFLSVRAVETRKWS
jgi:ABC-2 type transport system permease protein